MVDNEDSCTTPVHSSGPNEKTLLLFSDSKYPPPTPNDVLADLKTANQWIGCCRSRQRMMDMLRNWQTPLESSGRKPISYAPRRLMSIDAGLVISFGRSKLVQEISGYSRL